MGKNNRKKSHFFIYLSFFFIPISLTTVRFWLVVPPWFVLSLLLGCHCHDLGPGCLFVRFIKISLLDWSCFTVVPSEYTLFWNRTRSSTRQIFYDGPLFAFSLAFYHPHQDYKRDCRDDFWFGPCWFLLSLFVIYILLLMKLLPFPALTHALVFCGFVHWLKSWCDLLIFHHLFLLII